MTAHDRMNSGEDEPLDGTLRRVLAENGATRAYSPPDDLVQRTLRRLPPEPPRALHRAERSQRVAATILRSSSLAAVVLVVALSAWGALGGIPQLDARDRTAVRAFEAVVLPQAGGVLVLRATLAALVGLGLLVPSAVLLGRWPNRTGVAARALGRRPLHALLLGMPLAALLSALLPLAAQLALSVVGLPLAALLVAVAVAPQVVGLATLARAVGARFEGHEPGVMLGWPTAATAALAVLALVAATLAWPLAALVLFSLLAAPGLGAMLLTRVGTRPSA